MKLKLDDKGNVVVQDGKPVYVADDGKDIAFDAPGTVATISRLNGEAKGHRERAEKAEGALKAFDGITDPAAAIKAIDTIKNIDDKKLVDAGKVEEVRAAAVRTYEERLQAAEKAHGETVKKLNGDVEKLTGQLHGELIGGSFIRSKFIADKIAIPADLVQAAFGKHFKVEDGKVAAYDSAGNRVYSRARPGDPNVEFDEALEILVDTYPHKSQILKGTGSNGGGSKPGTGGSGGGKTMTRAQWDSSDQKARMDFSKAGGVVTD